MDLFAIPYPISKVKYSYPRDSEGLAKAWSEKCGEALTKNNGEQLPPGFVIFTEDAQHHLDARAFVNNSEGKGLMVALAKTLAKQHRAIGSIFVSEIWYAQPNMEDREKIQRGEKIVPPSQRPDKLECLMTIGEYYGKKPWMHLSSMVRDSMGRVTSLKPVLMPLEMKHRTIFDDILVYDDPNRG